jgi:hypothetical protein
MLCRHTDESAAHDSFCLYVLLVTSGPLRAGNGRSTTTGSAFQLAARIDRRLPDESPNECRPSLIITPQMAGSWCFSTLRQQVLKVAVLIPQLPRCETSLQTVRSALFQSHGGLNIPILDLLETDSFTGLLGLAAGIQKRNRQQKRNEQGAGETDPV